jgi:hypothetical protein
LAGVGEVSTVEGQLAADVRAAQADLTVGPESAGARKAALHPEPVGAKCRLAGIGQVCFGHVHAAFYLRVHQANLTFGLKSHATEYSAVHRHPISEHRNATEAGDVRTIERQPSSDVRA